MDMTIAARAEAHPVFILPGALNACAEEVGRALVELLLHKPGEGGMPGPVFVVDGDGLVDLRETITESMHGRMFAPGHPWRTRQASPPGRGCRVVGEGLAADVGRASPLFVEMDGESLSAAPPGAGQLGMLVRCRDAMELLTLASRCAAAPACYVHAGSDDAPLATLLARLLDRPPMRLTISADPVTTAWPSLTVPPSIQRGLAQRQRGFIGAGQGDDAVVALTIRDGSRKI